ncbi:MAG: PQQ-binding-like beta-propeller repeat protein, partial [Bacteroidota bacterium]
GDTDPDGRSQIQCNPLIIDGVLYGSTPVLKFFALNAATGEEIWEFDPFEGQYDQFGMGVNRGMAYWASGRESRILFTAGSFLYSVDAKTGKPDVAFGENGKTDLHKGLGREVDDLFIVSNSPGVVFEDLLILGSRVSESTGAAPGHIRAFNVRTGEVEWIFHTIPQPGQFGYETWPEDAWRRIGGANAWSGMSLDKERGMVFVPTGSASYDFYGGDRQGDNLFANCIIALNAYTGERIWHYQTVHHDLWDRDLPAPPNLVTVVHDGKRIDAVAQITKSALIFLLDRETGEPLFPIEEVPVEASRLNGEKASPTQPIPTKPAPFSRHTIEEKDLNHLTEENFQYAKAIWANSLKGSPYIPPSEEGTFVFPGFDGGGEWGGELPLILKRVTSS